MDEILNEVLEAYRRMVEEYDSKLENDKIMVDMELFRVVAGSIMKAHDLLVLSDPQNEHAYTQALSVIDPFILAMTALLEKHAPDHLENLDNLG